jgi:hypothetical protein
MKEVQGVDEFWRMIQKAESDPDLASVRVPKATMGKAPPALEIPEGAVKRLKEYRAALSQIELPLQKDDQRLHWLSNVRFLAIVGLSMFYLICVVIIIFVLRGSNDLTVVLGTHASAMVLFLVAIKMLITSDQKRSLDELHRERAEGFISAVALLAPNLDDKTMLIVLREAVKLRTSQPPGLVRKLWGQ